MKGKSAILSELGKDTIVQLVPGLEQLIFERGVVRPFDAGAEVAKRGEPITHLIIPLSGPLRLTISGNDVGTIQRLRSLGLRELLENRPYAYSAVADEPTTALFVPKAAFVELVDRVPNLSHYLRMMSRSAGVRSFVRFLEDHRIDFSDIVEAIATIPFETQSLEPGAELGDGTPTLWFIRRGTLRVTSTRSAQPLDVGEGAWLGGEAIVPPHGRSYVATATAPVSLHAVKLKVIRPLLERLGLVDAVYEEPWLDKGPQSTRSRPRAPRLTPLPGRPLGPDELAELALDVDPKRLVRAHSDEESVVASLCNVAAIMGGTVNPGRIAAGVELLDRVTALRLAEELESFGFLVRTTKVDRERPHALSSPALVFAGARLMVFLGARGDELLLLDPAAGVVAWTAAELAERWDGTSIDVTRTPNETPEADGERRPSTVLALLLRHRRLLGNMAGMMLLGFGLQLLGPLFLQYILDDVLTIGRFDIVWGLVAGLVLATIFRAAAGLGGYWLANELAVRFDSDLSLVFYRHALALPLSFYGKGRVGDIIVRLHEIQKIRSFFSSSTVGAAIGFVAIAAYTGMLFAFSVEVALTAVVMVVVLMGIQLASRRMLSRLYAGSFQASRRATSLIAEMFAAVTTVKASSAEEVLRARWEAAFLAGVSARRRVALRVNDLQAVINVLSSGGTTVALWFACAAVLAGDLSIGVIMAISMYLQAMLKPIQGLSNLLAQLEETGVAFDNLEDVLRAKPEEGPTRAMVTHSVQLRGKIRLDRVNFRYSPGSPLVLKEIDLTIYPNQVLAIVGRSGSGKSTLASMIAGYVQPTSGRIFYDHYDASMLSVACLRKQIGFVQQGYSLFSGTLSDNIAFTDDAPDAERISRAADAAYCEYVSRFPQGFEHTRDRARLLSGAEHPHHGRGDVRAGRRLGDRHQREHERHHARTDEHHHRPPHLDGAPRRPDHRHRER
ncbi:ATP-binding cassette domain-containing protein [Myxococcota bacterium]|nr:ATP-binding cassette domain-containing protein [Myxococcota bacterium]